MPAQLCQLSVGAEQGGIRFKQKADRSAKKPWSGLPDQIIVYNDAAAPSLSCKVTLPSHSGQLRS